MNGLKPNCLNDFLFSNANERRLLELILQRRLPFPSGGKSGILLHGVWGTGKSTLAKLLPDLLETAYSGTWNLVTNDVGAMPAPDPSHCQTKLFRCGAGGQTIVTITQAVEGYSSRLPIWHNSQHDYFVFDEVDRLTVGAQQSLRSTMDLPRCMFFFTTNYLSKIDPGIVNRCHLVEMNQVSTASAYVPLGNAILQNMGLARGAVAEVVLEEFARKSRGSLRDYTHAVIMQGIMEGGVVP
jgi:DNA polymerase III delta prime subunit